MPTFTELQQLAHFLPSKLRKTYEKHYTLGGIFCPCMPSVVGSEVISDALLIHHTAKCLEFYPEADDIKLMVLTGMYIYIWQRYGGAMNYLMNKPLLDILGEHLEINSLVGLDRIFYQSSFDELDNFCNWVYLNRKFVELELLYNSFPTDMRASIHIQKNQQPTGETTFTNTISDFIDNLCDKGLF